MVDNSFLLSLLGFLLILAPLVFIHELGHYLASIKSGVKVEVFSVGFGKEIFGFNDKNNTRWKICILPLGGYVKMQGEQLVHEKNEVSDYGDFNKASLWKRFLIVLSGPLANLILGVVLFSFVFSYYGKVQMTPIIDNVNIDGPAYNAGLKRNDKIIQIDYQKIMSFFHMKNIVEKNPNKKLLFTVERNSKNIDLIIVPKIFFDKKNNSHVGRIGISSKIDYSKREKLNIFQGIYYGFEYTINMTLNFIDYLFKFNFSKEDVAGPVGIAKMSGKALTLGFESFLKFAAVISINLGLINLFPIVPLDGGYIKLYLYELIFRKPMPSKYQFILVKTGTLFLIGLMIFIITLDFMK